VKGGVYLIAFISGICEFIGDKFAVVSNGGIGYKISTPCGVLSKISAGESVKFYTRLSSRDDGLFLYGFLDFSELETFNLLLGVSGVGPKSALAILDELSPDDLARAVLSDDIFTLTKCAGVGKKAAARIALELKDKLNAFAAPGQKNSGGSRSDALEALTALGYSRSEAARAVMQTAETDMESAAIIKAALKVLAKG
jgi:Holliday junction DNA helicase RuvA